MPVLIALAVVVVLALVVGHFNDGRDRRPHNHHPR